MPSSKVVKISESGPSEVLLSTPESVQPKLRFAKSEYPLIQTSELTYSHDNDMIEFFCTPEHADYIHQIDDILCTKIERKEIGSGFWIPKQRHQKYILCFFCHKLMTTKHEKGKHMKLRLL